MFSGMMLGGLLMLREHWARAGALLVFLCFTYVELLDKSNYLNHYYFVSLVAFMLIWLPTTLRTPQVPRMVVFSFRFMLGLVYGYAGIAKLNADWMLHAQPLASVLM